MPNQSELFAQAKRAAAKVGRVTGMREIEGGGEFLVEVRGRGLATDGKAEKAVHLVRVTPLQFPCLQRRQISSAEATSHKLNWGLEKSR